MRATLWAYVACAASVGAGNVRPCRTMGERSSHLSHASATIPRQRSVVLIPELEVTKMCLRIAIAGSVVLLLAGADAGAAAQQSPSETAATAQRALLDEYCVRCHNGRTTSGNLRLDIADVSAVGDHGEIWERVVRKLRGGMMPPPGNPRPDKVTYDGFASWLESELDRAAAARPSPGRTESLHRLNRTEYKNAIRDLFGLEIDFIDMLPVDESGGGAANFDNIASALRLTQATMDVYLSASRKVSRLVIGEPPPLASVAYRAEGARQHVPLEGMPFGTRGGIKFDHFFPVGGEYEFQLTVSGGRGKIDFSIDGERAKLFEVVPRAQAAAYGDAPARGGGSNLAIALPMKAGSHQVIAAFLRETATLKNEADFEPFEGRDGGGGPGLRMVVVRGPLTATGRGESPIRTRVFTCSPSAQLPEDACAKSILSDIARKAYRRPLTDHDVATLMELYEEGRAGGDFDRGVELGIRGILSNPNFLFRVEAAPAGARPGQPYLISDLELASRLSFFLWSSIPDDELLNLAIEGQLRAPGVLENQVRRMLADTRSSTLTDSFAAQWLWVRSLKSSSPAGPFFPNYDDALRQAFQREIELFFTSIVHEDRNVLDLLNADYTFVNDRLARHYGMPGVMGSHFRRVQLSADSPRRGLLGKGLILQVTSRPTRTSPVIRGRWILENLLGTPPGEPPPNVPALAEQKQDDGQVLTVRELMARHRSNPVCAACHATIDPAGFALEQFDGVGQWRTVDLGFQPIDASGQLPDGTKFADVNEFRELLLGSKRDQFLRTMTDKLMIYALGRGTEFYDAPAIRKVVKEAAGNGYRFSSIVLGIVKSTPFQMRNAGQLQGGL